MSRTKRSTCNLKIIASLEKSRGPRPPCVRFRPLGAAGCCGFSGRPSRCGPGRQVLCGVHLLELSETGRLSIKRDSHPLGTLRILDFRPRTEELEAHSVLSDTEVGLRSLFRRALKGLDRKPRPCEACATLVSSRRDFTDTVLVSFGHSLGKGKICDHVRFPEHLALGKCRRAQANASSAGGYRARR